MVHSRTFETTETKEATVVKRTKRILFVDDDDLLPRSFIRLMNGNEKRYDILTVRTSREALGIVKHEHINLVITGYRLEGRAQGKHLIEEMKRWGSPALIILFTGGNDTVDGVDARVIKSDMRELKHTIERLFAT
jgi:DNA-binding NtrC family response regulator